MDKRRFLQHIIHTLEDNQEALPGSVLDNLSAIKQHLSGMNDDQLEVQTNMVVPSPDGETYDPGSINGLLEEIYSELDDITDHTDNEDLIMVRNELRGFLDVPERYFP